ncbi:PQQ-dependent sugar dehydrogenase [Paractinoplanes brasiliensis]|uniref:Glucose/arabinose dehydrogenase n=1 Tax=Paractinoplanes brasiliensis TaxID=52695 RepID=A0A4R6JAK1_9ACTN|nr:PQQ-dependent sugar dehydrogenase [Actinoplanes brasiliensis]TDO32522.1 glucose/arabinose dehydrogenase [Actinoplanes brasiliensis]GID27602.1 oxidoreductase [Actinoplanes brasiliensis]
MRALPALAAVFALAACGSTAEAGDPDAPSSSPEVVATGIDVPWGLTFPRGGGALVAECDTGRILRITPGGQPEPVYEVPGVAAGGEGGLLGLAATGDWVYAYFTAADDNRIVRFKPASDAPPEVIFDGIAKAGNHNGGRIAFGPDGMLYVGTGDAGDTSHSQNPDSPNGKILRLTPEGDPAPGNPTAGSPVYSLGHRNVQGLAWDGNDRLFATEFGQNDVDEVNRIEPGRNYGWPDVEGEGGTDGGRFTNPLVTWPTSDASPSGLAIAGNTLYAAGLRGERLWTVPIEGDGLGEPRAILEGEFGRLRTVEVAPDGSLWVTTSNTDGRGDVRDGDDRILRLTPR